MRSKCRIARVLAVITVTTLGACGGDDSATKTTAVTVATTSAAAAAVAGATTAPSAAGTTGGTTAGGATIKIGVANNEGPNLSIPDYRFGAEAAVKYINEKLGGVNGSKLEIVGCISDATPEGSVNCANKFTDAGVAAYFAAIDVGADAALPVLSQAHIPYVSTEPWGPNQKTDPNSWVFGPPQGAYSAGPLKALKDGGASHVGVFFLDQPTSRDLVENVAQPLAAKLGLTLDTVFVDPGSPNWDSAVATLMAKNVDSMWGILPEPSCTAVVQAARNGGFTGPIAVGSCSQYVSAVGDQALDTLSVSSTWYPSLKAGAPKTIADQMDVYSDAMKAAGHEGSINTFATSSFATMIELSEVMKTVNGPVTATTLTTALGQAKDLPGFLRDDLKCRANLWPSEPASCRTTLLVMKVVKGAKGPERQPVSPNMIDVSGLAV